MALMKTYLAPAVAAAALLALALPHTAVAKGISIKGHGNNDTVHSNAPGTDIHVDPSPGKGTPLDHGGVLYPSDKDSSHSGKSKSRGIGIRR